MSQQSLRHASFRAIGSTAGTYGDDARAAFAAEVFSISEEAVEVPAGATANEAMILWLQQRLGSSATNINDLMAEFAAAEGATNWGAVGTIAAAE